MKAVSRGQAIVGEFLSSRWLKLKTNSYYLKLLRRFAPPEFSGSIR